jgi:CMP-N-acetylneuraminic acid synthetase
LKVLGVVTARAGSKGIPGKNTRLLAGRPLIQYTIDAARESSAFDRLVLSTDDQQAATIARESGCEVPFMRPATLFNRRDAALAGDAARTVVAAGPTIATFRTGS